MNDMNPTRIQKWKCLFCGSRRKRKVDVLNVSNRVIGFSLVCCGCGHVDNFSLSQESIEMYVCGIEVNADSMKIYCPFTAKSVKQYCNKENCKYRPVSTSKHATHHPTVYMDDTSSSSRPNMKPVVVSPTVKKYN